MRSRRLQLRSTLQILSTSGLLGVLVLLAACGGGSNSAPPPSPTPTPTPGASTAVTQFRIGDAPADRVIAFELTIGNPVVLTPNGGGNPVNLTVGANRLEISHMSGKLEPLSVANIPQGSYSSAAIVITNPEMTFLNGGGTQTTLHGSATQTVTVTFSPALTIGNAPVVVNVDLNVSNSIATDQAGNITGFNFSGSSFNITTKSVAPEAQQEDDDGEMESIAGLVTSVSGNNFTMKAGQSGAQLTFATDTNTQFSDGLTNVASALNQIVSVEGVTRTDGSLLAKEVEGIESQNGAEADGLVTSVTGNPATSLSFTDQDGMGNGMDDTKVGATFTVDVSGVQGSHYKVDQGNVDFSGLQTGPGTNFPFDETTIHEGQRAEIESLNMMPAPSGTMIAEKVKLEQQALTGTVSNFTAGSGGAASFDLNLANDGSSYLTILSGETLVHVFQQPGTDNKFGAITNGSTVRVRGLLFWSGTTFNMIARRVTQ
jgi:Domain of unknown function (DUF5666)